MEIFIIRFKFVKNLTYSITENGFAAESVNISVFRVLGNRHQLSVLVWKVLVVDHVVINQRNSRDMVRVLQQHMKLCENEGYWCLTLPGDVACCTVVVGLLGKCQRLFARNEVWTVRNLIEFTEKDSRFCQPSKSFRKFVLLNKVEL